MSKNKLGFTRYLPVNQEALRWEIYCNDAGYAQVPPGSDYPVFPQDHPKSYADNVATGRILREFQVIYVTAGRGWFRDHLDRLRNIRSGDMFMLFPDIRHAYSPMKDTGWQEYWVGFSGEHANRLYENGLFDPARPIHHLGINRDIMADYEEIIHLCRQQTPGFQVLLGALVLQLLAHLHATEMSQRTTQEDSGLIQTARSIMQLHLEEGLEVDQLALELGLSYPRLLDIFRQYTGLTPYQYYLQLRVHRAKELLQNPELSIKEVSGRMNFENQYYFSRFFKKKTGYTPSDWQGRRPED